MKIFLKYENDLSRVANYIEDLVRGNSDIRFSVYEKTADFIIDLGYTHPTGKNSLHVVFYDRNEIIKHVSDCIYNSGKSRNIPVDYGKIDNRLTQPNQSTIYIKLGRPNYEMDEGLWASAIAEGIISALDTQKQIEDIKVYKKPSGQKTIYERNFAQEPTRNSDIFFGNK